MWSSYILDFKARCFHSPKNEMILRTSKCKCVAFLDIVMNMPDTLSERLNCLRKTEFPVTTLRSTVTGSWHLWTTNEAWPLVELMLHCAPEQLAKGRQFAGCWGYEKWIQDPGAGDWLVTTEMKKKVIVNHLVASYDKNTSYILNVSPFWLGEKVWSSTSKAKPMRVIPCSPATKQSTNRRSILYLPCLRLPVQVVVDRRDSCVTSVMLI